MDIRLKFKKEPKDYNDRTCIIVVEVEDLSIGIIVDEVAEVMKIDDENIVPPPSINKDGKKYIKSIAKNGEVVILILDCEKLLNEDEVEELKIANE